MTSATPIVPEAAPSRSLFSIQHVMGLIDKKHAYSMLMHRSISRFSQLGIIVDSEAVRERRRRFGVAASA